MTISFEKPYYNFIKYENVESLETYYKFLNWTKGEFDLFQQEELDGLKVFYPNGWFSIIAMSRAEKNINIRIKIKSKTLNDGKKVEAKIKSIYNQINKISTNKNI